MTQIRTAWPEVKIILRGDSGFCRNELMSRHEDNGVYFVFGLARDKKLRKQIPRLVETLGFLSVAGATRMSSATGEAFTL